MTTTNKIEKFEVSDLTSLRNGLKQTGIDSWQAADLLTAFLADRGYGVNSQQVREAVLRMEHSGCSPECMQSELEQLALVV